MNIPTCQYCGKRLPYHIYGGVGSCDCEASKKAREEERIREAQESAAREITKRRLLHIKAHSCIHEFEGAPDFTHVYCRKCGIKYRDYLDYR